MKRNLLFVLLFMSCFNVNSQEVVGNEGRTQNKPESVPHPAEAGNKPIGETKKNQTITISKRPGEPQRVHDAAYYQEEIAKIDNHIEAIDKKIEYVNNTPEEKALAESNGWFEDMETMKSRLKAKKEGLQEKLNNL